MSIFRTTVPPRKNLHVNYIFKFSHKLKRKLNFKIKEKRNSKVIPPSERGEREVDGKVLGFLLVQNPIAFEREITDAIAFHGQGAAITDPPGIDIG